MPRTGSTARSDDSPGLVLHKAGADLRGALLIAALLGLATVCAVLATGLTLGVPVFDLW